jgi:hypothetical protein
MTNKDHAKKLLTKLVERPFAKTYESDLEQMESIIEAYLDSMKTATSTKTKPEK